MSISRESTRVAVGHTELKVASLTDIVKSKRAAGRPKDYAVLTVLEATLDEAQAPHPRRSPRRPRTRR
jgi:hypothetical protein